MGLTFTFAIVLICSTYIPTIARQLRSLAECPSTCRCVYTDEMPVSADCSGHGLMSVPNGLPSTLQRLVLSNNNISLINCDDIANLSQLLYLDLSSNKLQYLQCCDMKSVYESPPNDRYHTKTILFSANGQLPCQTPLSRLAKLQTLILHANPIFRLKAFQFSGLINLHSLDLSQNPLSEIDQTSFKGLPSLIFLNLEASYVAHLPDNLFEDLTNLKNLTLHLSENHALENCYSDKALSWLKNLKSFRVNGLPSPCVLGPGFRNLTQLSLLDFTYAGCSIVSLSEFFFSNITTQANLTVVMNNCQMKYIHPNTFASLPTMVSLDISFNEDLGCKHVYLASSSFPRTKIKEFNMNGINAWINDMHFLRLTSATFKYIGNTSLEILKLAHNSILIIDIGVAHSLPRTLKSIDLSNNNILSAVFLFTLPILVNLEILIVDKQNKFGVSDALSKRTHTLENDKLCHVLQDNVVTSEISKQSPLYQHSRFTDSIMLPCETISKQPKFAALFMIQESRKNGGYLTYADWSYAVYKVCPSNNPHVFEPKLKEPAIKITQPALNWLLESLTSEMFSFNIGSNGSSCDNNVITLPKNLRQIHMSHLKLGYSIPSFGVMLNHVLWYLNASHNFLWCFEGPIMGTKALEVLDLTSNFAIAVNPGFFGGWKRLLHLRLSDNLLSSSFELDKEGLILSWLEKLEILEIKRNGLRSLSLAAFAQNKMLQTINLADNDLHDLPFISHLRYLTNLDISSNLFKSLSDHVMSGLDNVMLFSDVTVDLSGNPLACDCSSLPFLKWFQRTNVTFVKVENYTCTFINKTTVDLRNLDEIVSRLSRICVGKNFFIASLSLFFVIVLFGIFLALIHYYTYRLLFYVYFSRQQFLSRLYELERSGLRDVFLVYDDQDRNCRHHVSKVLVPNLAFHGLTYHVSEIGLHSPSAGRSVRDVVEEAVLGGRKTLVLLTEEIFLDEDKQLEVGMARITEEMLGIRRLIFLSAQKLEPKTLPVHIYHLLRTSRIISYDPSSGHFWSRLAREIRS